LNNFYEIAIKTCGNLAKCENCRYSGRSLKIVPQPAHHLIIAEAQTMFIDIIGIKNCIV